MGKITWTVGGGKGKEKLPFLTPLVVTANTPKEQLSFIEGWTLMRDRLIELGEMEEQ